MSRDRIWRAVDVVVLGAGAAGLMAAIEAGKRGRSVVLLDHAKTVGEKIRISGGGRCNFTNIHTGPANFLSRNPRFCRSALAGYTQHDFIALIDKHRIAYHEKILGQLFCDGSARQVIDMLLAECAAAGVAVETGTTIAQVVKPDDRFVIATDRGRLDARAVIVATGGLSIPKIGATGFGYDIARSFGLRIVAPRPALVPLTFGADLLAQTKPLSGVSVDAEVSCGKTRFAEGLLFTHRGLSGPSILQISSYWREGETIAVDLARGVDAFARLKAAKQENPRQQVPTALAAVLPRRMAEWLCAATGATDRLAETSDARLRRLADRVNRWAVTPQGSEGYRTAEVTLGGVDTRDLSSKTMQATAVPGLYFIGEVVDVTGHLGGFNFQWAWASGAAAGRAV
ncbi:MAG: NAD(P)/FAD-dependent oxidoreductase [Alphaproteobacteria bacterium]|nr:NAD(P)/FAD-dependent oxidoreductase [Alphaproteobacteria bacterium]